MILLDQSNHKHTYDIEEVESLIIFQQLEQNKALYCHTFTDLILYNKMKGITL
jgi:hypothetical protein